MTRALATALFALALLFGVEAVGSEVPIIRVGLEMGSSVALGSDTDWVVGAHRSGLRPARVSAGRQWTIRAIEGSILRIADGTYVREVTDTLFVHPVVGSDGSLVIAGKKYRGEALVFARDGRLFVINVIDIESYIRGVVPLEIGSQNAERFEAVKAQAVAARSYTLSMLGRWRQNGYDLKDTVEDQAYGGRDVETDRCDRAVEDTRGVIATYNGKPILAYYSSTSGGHTAHPSEVWDREDLPYLKAVRDRAGKIDDSFCDISPFYKWEESWTIAQFEKLLDDNLPSRSPGWTREEYGAFRDIEILSRTDSKRVAELELRFEHGSIVLRGDAIRWAVRRSDGGGLRSTLFERVAVRRSGARPLEVKIVGRGYGHGVGLCQYGAMGMSQAGYDYTQILRFYYRGTELRKYY